MRWTGVCVVACYVPEKRHYLELGVCYLQSVRSRLLRTRKDGPELGVCYLWSVRSRLLRTRKDGPELGVCYLRSVRSRLLRTRQEERKLPWS